MLRAEQITHERDIRYRQAGDEQCDDTEERRVAVPLGAVVANARASARGKGVRLHDEDGFPPLAGTPASPLALLFDQEAAKRAWRRSKRSRARTASVSRSRGGALVTRSASR